MKYKDYRNPYTNDNRIYSFTDIYNMALGEVLKRKQELLGQYRVLGVPKEEELQASDNVVYVHSYTRDDGVEVKAHYRSKPDGSGVDNLTKSESYETKIKEDKTEQVEVNPENNYQEQNQEQNNQTKEMTLEQKDEKDKRLYPDEIAGVKRGKPMSPSEAGGKNVNPNYDSDDIGYKLNCTSCVPVHKAREMGFNIEALPAKAEEDGHLKMLRRYPYYAFEPLEGEKDEVPTKLRSNNPKDCINNLNEKIKQGECYEFWYHPPKTEDGFAHTVEVSKNNIGELEVYDPQNGQTYGKEYFNKISYSLRNGLKKYYYPQYIYRIDNKVPKHKILEKISRPSQRQIQ